MPTKFTSGVKANVDTVDNQIAAITALANNFFIIIK